MISAIGGGNKRRSDQRCAIPTSLSDCCADACCGCALAIERGVSVERCASDKLTRGSEAGGDESRGGRGGGGGPLLEGRGPASDAAEERSRDRLVHFFSAGTLGGRRVDGWVCMCLRKKRKSRGVMNRDIEDRYWLFQTNTCIFLWSLLFILEATHVLPTRSAETIHTGGASPVPYFCHTPPASLANDEVDSGRWHSSPP